MPQTNERRRALYPQNKEKIRAQNRRYYLKNQERLKAETKAYRKENAEVVRERDRIRNARPERKLYQAINNKIWRELNKEEQADKVRAWHIANPGRGAEYARKRRALKLNATIKDISQEDIAARVAYYGGKCAYCPDGEYEHLDHVIPLARGGKHCPANLRPACEGCNLSKKDKPLDEWLIYRKLVLGK